MIRSFEEQDLTCIVSNWKRSYSRSDWARHMTPESIWQRNAKDDPRGRGEGGDVYFQGHARLILELLRRSVVLVAVADDGLIDGWVCGWPGEVLHYVYTREHRRKRGIARSLLEALDLRRDRPVRYTHVTPRIAAAKPSAPPAWTYDPYRMLQERTTVTMAKRRVSHFTLEDNSSIQYKDPITGTLERKESFRASDRFTAHFDTQTGIIELRGYDSSTRKDADVFVHLSKCKYAVCHDVGELPLWEQHRNLAAKLAGKIAEVTETGKKGRIIRVDYDQKVVGLQTDLENKKIGIDATFPFAEVTPPEGFTSWAP